MINVYRKTEIYDSVFAVRFGNIVRINIKDVDITITKEGSSIKYYLDNGQEVELINIENLNRYVILDGRDEIEAIKNYAETNFTNSAVSSMFRLSKDDYAKKDTLNIVNGNCIGCKYRGIHLCTSKTSCTSNKLFELRDSSHYLLHNSKDELDEHGFSYVYNKLLTENNKNNLSNSVSTLLSQYQVLSYMDISDITRWDIVQLISSIKDKFSIERKTVMDILDNLKSRVIKSIDLSRGIIRFNNINFSISTGLAMIFMEDLDKSIGSLNITIGDEIVFNEANIFIFINKFTSQISEDILMCSLREILSKGFVFNSGTMSYLNPEVKNYCCEVLIELTGKDSVECKGLFHKINEGYVKAFRIFNNELQVIINNGI